VYRKERYARASLLVATTGESSALDDINGKLHANHILDPASDDATWMTEYLEDFQFLRSGMGDYPEQKNRADFFNIRLRHPEGKRMRSVTINGLAHEDFDSDKECVSIKPASERLVMRAYY
jgi:hypothetical protein